MEDKLRQELQQLSPAQLRQLLSASGHGQLLRGDEENAVAPCVDEQLVTKTKDEGNAFFRQGRMNDAVSAYSRCIEMDLNNAVCLSNRAAAYLKLKHFDLAVKDCTKAIAAAPTIKSFMRRATAYIALRNYEQAVTDLAAALEFEPKNKECRAKLQAVVDTTTERGENITAELRRAGIRAAVVYSACEGWERSTVRGNPGPAAVNGHTLFKGDNGRIYLLGGRAVREQKLDVFVLNESDGYWDTVPIQGTTSPSSRSWHSTSPIGIQGSGVYCVYGGVSSRGEDPNVHLLTPTSPRGFQWLQPLSSQDVKEIPASRSGHAAVSVAEDNGNRAVFIFGGRTKRGVSDQLLILRYLPADNDSNVEDTAISWEEITPQDAGTETRPSWPSARDGHSMCLLSAEKQTPRLIVFGGNGQLNDERMNDVWIFDVEKHRWTLLQCSGDIPLPRSYHTAHTVGEFLFVVGGRTGESEDGSVYMLDIQTAEWFKVRVPSDHALTPRAWHSSVFTDAGQIFVLGGGTYHGPLKEAATLDLSYFQTKASSLSQVPIENENASTSGELE
ncbi:RNA polymerase II-associated protein 3 [Phytophthora citrophthora]|uniref:RNA polymerase II-associated protein 3 n=1 Tax=Phytophthora citrophthora TaxID=4793 RepID=A0AAD9G4X4_9STRA|nr:RNA polymerase II-associated protein 3 [Phytophthora citrophthora]